MDGPIPDPSTLDEGNDNQIIHDPASDHVLMKKQFSSITPKSTKQIYTKDYQISNNLFSFSDKKEASLHDQNPSSQQNSIKSKEPLFKSNLKNYTNILESHEPHPPKIHEKSSRASLKTSILSLYSTTSTSQPNILPKSSVKDTCLHEDHQTSKHESKLSDNFKDTFKSIQELNISQEEKISHTSESSHQFLNPAVSYLLNSQKSSPVSTSHGIIAMKDNASKMNRKQSYSKEILSNDNIFDSENLYLKSCTTDVSKILPNPDKDPSSKQWDNDSLTFNAFQSSNFFVDSDTLSFHTSPWSTDEPKEIQQNSINCQKDALDKDGLHDKGMLFYDDSIISTTDVWK